MKAGLRSLIGLAFATVLAVAPVAVRAQSEEPAANDSGTVGPRERQDFTINGTVTQPAPQRPAATPPPAPAPATAAPAPARDRPAPSTSSTSADARPVAPDRPAASPGAGASPPAARPASQAPQGSSVTVALPPLGSESSAPAEPIADFEPAPDSGGVSLLPWMLAGFALLLGGLFLWWQKRDRPVFAAGPEAHAFAAPEPAPSPIRPRAAVAPLAPAPLAPAPPPPVPATDPFAGLVSTRLRPWVDLAFEPARCAVEDDQVIIDFEIAMMNRGNAPARAVLVEARMVNAGPSQDAEIGQFFSNPVGEGERIDSIAPLKTVRIKSRIVAPRDQVQIYDVGGRKVFVPLVAFNVLYSWSRGAGQTSLGFLVGRDTKSAKMAPFRADIGPRLFRGLGQTPLPLEIRQ